MAPLTDEQKAMLELAGTHYKYAGAKEAAMRDQFGMSPTIFWVEVNRLLSYTPALAWNPMLVGRLIRLREARKAVRTA